MKNKKKIKNRIDKLILELEIIEESYFSIIEDKQKGEKISEVDFLKIESEYEIIKKEIKTLKWVLK